MLEQHLGFFVLFFVFPQQSSNFSYFTSRKMTKRFDIFEMTLGFYPWNVKQAVCDLGEGGGSYPVQ
jgi:hypothetical protein